MSHPQPSSAWNQRGQNENYSEAVALGRLGPDPRHRRRLQWFDLQGRFLGERRYGGQFYNVTFDKDGQLWASVHPKGVSLDEEFSVVKLDLATGRILGRVDGRSHELGIGADGAIYPASRAASLVLYRPRR